MESVSQAKQALIAYGVFKPSICVTVEKKLVQFVKEKNNKR